MTRRGSLLFAAMCVLWGIPYLLIKVAVRDLTPASIVFLRTAIGAAVLLPFIVAGGQVQGLVRRWRPLVLYTVVELAIPWLLLSTAEKRLPSSLTGLLVAAVPLIGAALAGLFGWRERLGARGFGGLLLGLAGVGVLVGFDVHGADGGSVAMVAVVVFGYALGPQILAKHLQDLPGLGVVAGSLALCAVAYAPVGIAQLPSRMPNGRVVASIVTLGLVCTALAFVLFFHLIGEIGPVRATVITYVNPAVAVLLGVTFLEEHIGVATGIGFVLIITGSVLATVRRAPGDAATSGELEPATVAEP